VIRRIVATVALIAIAFGSMSMATMLSSRERPACCKNPASCPMHQTSAGGAQLDRCPADANHDALMGTSVRAVLVEAALTFPDASERQFVNSLTIVPSALADGPRLPPPRSS
jgi:hypothetical protein